MADDDVVTRVDSLRLFGRKDLPRPATGVISGWLGWVSLLRMWASVYSQGRQRGPLLRLRLLCWFHQNQIARF